MNAWFAGGVLAGILAVAIYGIWKKRKENGPRYDERQAQARANAARETACAATRARPSAAMAAGCL